MHQVGVSIPLIMFMSLSSMKKEQLETLIYNYANHVIDSMDMDTVVQFAFDTLITEFNKYSEEELVSEIQELYDEDVFNQLMENV